jgi:hypothetical protein
MKTRIAVALSILTVVGHSAALGPSASTVLPVDDASAALQDPAQQQPAATRVLHGEVATVQMEPIPGGTGYLVNLLVQSGSEVIPVQLGPSWFIEHQPIHLEPGDKIQISGSEVSTNGQTLLVASQVRKGREILRLRGDHDRPVWAAWHPEAPPQIPNVAPQLGGQGSSGTYISGQALWDGGKGPSSSTALADLEFRQSELERQLKLNETNHHEESAALARIFSELLDQHNEIQVQRSILARMDSELSQRAARAGQAGLSELEPKVLVPAACIAVVLIVLPIWIVRHQMARQSGENTSPNPTSEQSRHES